MKRNGIGMRTGIQGSIKGAAVGLATLLAAAGAQANNVINPDIAITGGTTFYGALHTDNIDFTDVFTFSVEGSVLANLSLTTIGSGAQNIDFVSATLNGVPVTLSPNGFVETGSLGDTALTGPLVLTVTGKSGAANGIFATYSGTINVTVVPEPSTALLMGLGLGGLVLATRRARA